MDNEQSAIIEFERVPEYAKIRKDVRHEVTITNQWKICQKIKENTDAGVKIQGEK